MAPDAPRTAPTKATPYNILHRNLHYLKVWPTAVRRLPVVAAALGAAALGAEVTAGAGEDAEG